MCKVNKIIYRTWIHMLQLKNFGQINNHPKKNYPGLNMDYKRS